ncbi:hypothetical protein [Mycoplasma zalophidermidis]|nr:hypothetical protein [Mycoplasma zalophidermidis]
MNKIKINKISELDKKLTDLEKDNSFIKEFNDEIEKMHKAQKRN